MSPTLYPNQQSCLVDAALASKFEVTVPKKITLSGSAKSGTYSVTCKGDIAGNESVSVVPDATFTMSQTEKATVQAAVTQEKTMFRGSDYTKSLGDAVRMGPAAGDSTGTPLTGSIAAPDLSAGAWSGTFNFTIGLKEVLDPVTLTKNNLSSYVDAETGEAIATSGDVVIPAVVKNKDTGARYQVTGLDGNTGRGIFSNPSAVTSVVIPDSVKYIGIYVFYGCSKLTSITIPESVTSIGNYAFSGCSGLTSITVDSKNTVYNSRESCNALIETKTNKLIKGCNNTVIPEGVTSIGDDAFSGCSGLTSITIPDSVTSIGSGAFQSCNGLTSITIPEGVTSIGSYAFCNCSGLTSITIPDSVTSIGSGAFQSCNGLTAITIPDSVKNIEFQTFFGCRGLTSITIPDSVTSIGEKAFSSCSGLTSITIPDGVTSIGNSAFFGCSGLTSITIPEGVTSIGNSAFYECRGLTSITVDSNNTVYDSREDCNAIIETKTNKLIKGCNNSVIPSDVTSIEEYAFYGCSGLTSITIPEGVTSIEEYAFYKCSGLTSINIPDSVTSIRNGAFSECSGLTSITIPESVTSIGYSAFYWCRRLSSITYKDQAYTNKSALTQVLKDNNVILGSGLFDSTSLSN